MKIDYKKLEKKFWFEDENGNELNEKNSNADILFYHSCFPLELHEFVYEYCYHPENPIIKILCKNNFLRKHISKGKIKTFKQIYRGTTSFGNKYSQDCIVAMVNSGDFTLEQAILVYANSCERCMNALLHKYLDGKEGYEEYSDEWHKCNTICDFCRGDAEGEGKT